MPHHPYKALYVHIPFCVNRCNYCDFETRAIPRESAIIDEYIEGVILEIRRLSKAEELGQIQTIYVGGGTPTHIGSARLSSLLYALTTSVKCTGDDFEFTVEANPESLSENLIKDMWALGVNRLSIGVQSFNDELLRLLGRSHTARVARTAIEQAMVRFDNVSADVICGIPGQSEEDLRMTLEELIDLNVKHISVYPLAIEPSTPFDHLVLVGQLENPDEDMQAAHMELAQALLEDAGFHRYEVASYAKPGYESKHNSVYWSGVPYLGIGHGATTMTQNDERRMRVTNGEVVDDLTRPQMEVEDLMLGMRMSRGISENRLDMACRFVPGASDVFATLVEQGLIVHQEGRFIPTQLGWLCGNELYSSILELSD